VVVRTASRVSRYSLSLFLSVNLLGAIAPTAIAMTSQGTAHGRFQRAIHRRHVQAEEMAAREMGTGCRSPMRSHCASCWRTSIRSVTNERRLRWLRGSSRSGCRRSQRLRSPLQQLEQTLRIAEDLIRQGKTEDGLSLVRMVNDVTEAEAMRRIGRTAER
jgi:hypothetical protein